ncbi:MAG: hypothetical protein AAF196_20765 [Planctomycetota bacterium]
MPSKARIAAALAVFLLTLGLFPSFSDGRLAVFDPFDYGERIVEVERLSEDDGFVATHPNHLLFNLAVYELSAGLDLLGFEHPGHLATRLLGALGAALCLLAVSAFAGPRQQTFGLLCALPLVASRGFLFDAAAGESVLPATACGLYAMALALRENLPIVRLTLLLFLTVATRQDGLWFLPAIAILAGPRLGLRNTVACLGIAGALTAALYLGIWAIRSQEESLLDYLLGLGQRTDWSLSSVLGIPPAHLMAEAFQTTLIGRFEDYGQNSLWFGGLTLVLLLGSAGLLSAHRALRLPLAIASVLVLRVGFFLVFEPQNWEWQLPNLALLCALIAWAARSFEGFHAPRQRLVALLLTGLAIGSLSQHLEWTLRARQNRLQQAMRLAVDEAGDNAVLYVIGFKAERLLQHDGHDVRRIDNEGNPALPTPETLLAQARTFAQVAPASPIPVALLVDTFVRDGQPHTIRELESLLAREEFEGLPPILEPLEFDGRLVGWLKR